MDWVTKAFVFTVDITGGWPVDWWMGYLNYQTIHHLWPSMPQHNSPLIQNRLQQFADRFGLTYQEAVYATFSNLNRIGKSVWNRHNQNKYN